MPLDASQVGHRVVVRFLVRGERGPTGGPAMTDVLGVLRSYGSGGVTVERRDGTSVSVPLKDIVAAKPVLERPAPRRPGAAP
ncbi:MAG: hypothetical protein ACR2KL_10535 [Nocardioidaceae bacterium]